MKRYESMPGSRAGKEWFENIRVGDKVYLFKEVHLNCLYSPVGKIGATVVKKEIGQKYGEERYIMLCDIDETDKRFCESAMESQTPVAFECEDFLWDSQGNHMSVSDRYSVEYQMFTSEEVCDRYIGREKAYVKLHSFLNDEECLVDCGKDGPGKISTFHLSDYSLEDIQAAVNALRVSEMPKKLARFYNWEEYV